MPTQTLPWFPPAPSEGPASILRLPGDDYALEVKVNGCRVIWFQGMPFTRLGKILAPSKGAAQLSAILRGITETLDGEWADGKYWLFDLPDHRGEYDERKNSIVTRIWPEGVVPISPRIANFQREYDALRDVAEGVVIKKRSSRYEKMARPGTETPSWRKRRYCWDL